VQRVVGERPQPHGPVVVAPRRRRGQPRGALAHGQLRLAAALAQSADDEAGRGEHDRHGRDHREPPAHGQRCDRELAAPLTADAADGDRKRAGHHAYEGGEGDRTVAGVGGRPGPQGADAREAGHAERRQHARDHDPQERAQLRAVGRRDQQDDQADEAAASAPREYVR
jgi:hypothetical protein